MSSQNHHLDEWAALVGADLPDELDGRCQSRRGRDDARASETGFDAR